MDDPDPDRRDVVQRAAQNYSVANVAAPQRRGSRKARARRKSIFSPRWSSGDAMTLHRLKTSGGKKGIRTPMTHEYHHFTIGHFECMSVSDGGHDYQLAHMFANAPLDQVTQALVENADLPTDRLYTPYTCLYVNTGMNHILVDMGGGQVMPEAGKLIDNLRASGIDPEQIDTVIITHAHPDHVGGTVTPEGDLICPNARYFIWRREWDFWRSETADAQAPAAHVALARDRLASLDGRVKLVEPDAEIAPGVWGIDAAGHTPGHMALRFVSEGVQLLHISDTVLYPLHLEHPDWLPVFDILPEEARASKQRIFDWASSGDALVFAHHFPPFPNIGHIAKRSVGWEWLPVERVTPSGGEPTRT